MNTRKRLASAAVASLAAVAATVALYPADGQAAGPHPPLSWTSVPANPDIRGIAVPDALSPQLRQYAVAQGSMALENPDGVVGFYGYNANGPLIADPTIVQAPGHNVEANKTEPDKNTYLHLRGLTGADSDYDYGTHFLYAGHETGVQGYITRVNLDTDAAHRVTLIADKLADGTPIPTIDGSTWDPWAQRLLFTTESPNNASVMQATPDIGASVQDISPALGRAGYEGIQNDSAGNLWLVEDVGGATAPGTNAKNPNSFVYRFLPYDKTDLTRGGKLQALQVMSARTHQPITFQPIDATHPTGGIFTADQADLSTYGHSFDTAWVTIHDTATDTSGLPFAANTLAKAAGATPFKRPENGVFRPGTHFGEFYFGATGDTTATSTANTGFGGWGTLFKLAQSDPSADHGTLSVFYQGDQATRSVRQRHLHRQQPCRIRRRRRRWPAPAAQRVRLGVPVRRAGQLRPRTKPNPIHRRGPGRLRHAGQHVQRTRQRLPQRRRQRGHRHPHVRRRPHNRRHPRRQEREALPRRLATVLEPTTRRQLRLGDPSRLQLATITRGGRPATIRPTAPVTPTPCPSPGDRLVTASCRHI